MYDVICFGSALLDIFVKTEADYIKIHNPFMDEVFLSYPVGTKIEVKDLNHAIGGGGTNTSCTFARMGLHTGLITKLGGDIHGLDIFKWLRQEGITFLGAIGEQTGTSIILDSVKEDRTILTFKGSSNQLRWKELEPKKINANWFYFSSMSGESFKTMEKLCDHAHKHRIKIAFNPSSYMCEGGLKKLRKVISHTSVLILNREEAKLLTHVNNTDKMLKMLYHRGPEIVVITAGKKGVYVYDGEHFYHANKTKRLRIVETTGAGDAFASAFISGLVLNKDIGTSIKLGMNNAESVIQNYGAKNEILTKTKAYKKLRTVKRKVFKHRI